MFDAKAGWAIGVRVWVTRHGLPVVGPGRADLLTLISEHHSISRAAKALGMSYRRAWGLVQSMNEAAGEPLVTAAAGGAKGGGADLTPCGRELLAEYHSLVARVVELTSPSGPSPVA